MKTPTAQEFRKAKREDYEKIGKLIDENYQAFHDVAEKLTEGTRVETVFGDWTFIPDPKFAYE